MKAGAPGVHGTGRAPQSEQEVDEELGFHLEERTPGHHRSRDLAEAARGDGRLERFGDVARVRTVSASLPARERAAEVRRTLWRVSVVDVKLGLRMLAK